jgi:hypothetical protein
MGWASVVCAVGDGWCVVCGVWWTKQNKSSEENVLHETWNACFYLLLVTTRTSTVCWLYNQPILKYDIR